MLRIRAKGDMGPMINRACNLIAAIAGETCSIAGRVDAVEKLCAAEYLARRIFTLGERGCNRELSPSEDRALDKARADFRLVAQSMGGRASFPGLAPMISFPRVDGHYPAGDVTFPTFED